MRNNKLIFGIVFFISAIMLMPPMYNQNAFADEIDLNTWNQEGKLSSGTWTVAPDGSSVFQSINGSPTMFVSPDSVINAAIGGTIKVETTGDNDYIGFVMGFGEDDTDEFILLDWKQGCQSGSFPGFVLARVTNGAGNIPFGSHHLSKSNYEVLGTGLGSCQQVGGWKDNTSYDFIIEYNSNRIVVKVFGGEFGDDGEIVIDVEGDFSEGRFGFYNFSQSSVRYSGFVDDPEPLTKKKSNGGDEAWKTRPTSGLNYENGDQLVINGFGWNDNFLTINNNHYQPFDKQVLKIGERSTLTAKVYASNGLASQSFGLGIQDIGSNEAEVELQVNLNSDGSIDSIKVIQKTNVVDPETVTVSNEKAYCKDGDAEKLCDQIEFTFTLQELLQYETAYSQHIDDKRRVGQIWVNHGFEITGEPINPMLTKMIPSTVRYEGLLKVTQIAKYSPYWVADDHRMFEMNSFGSFKQINQSFERFHDTGTAYTRMHSGFGGIIAYEQNRALNIFDASSLVSELPASFAHIFPETGQRITEEMRQAMLLQEEIANRVLEDMDRQDRHY